MENPMAGKCSVCKRNLRSTKLKHREGEGQESTKLNHREGEGQEETDKVHRSLIIHKPWLMS